LVFEDGRSGAVAGIGAGGDLAGLIGEQLDAVERLCALVEFGAPAALRPAEWLSDAEAVEEWRRLCGAMTWR
jgi:hypothetical protein